MRRSLTIVALLSLSVPCLSMNLGIGQAASSDGSELKAMAAINLQDFNGKKVAADRFKDKVVILDFWATWCAPCIKEIPFLSRLQEKYKDQGLEVVGVTLASGEAREVKPFISRLKMGYSVLMGDDDQAYDLNIMGFPTTYLVTKDWKVYRKYVGSSPAKSQQMESDLQELLAAKVRP